MSRTLLDYLTKSPYLSGAILTAGVFGEHNDIEIKIGNYIEHVAVKLDTRIKDDAIYLTIKLSFSHDFLYNMGLIAKKTEKIQTLDGFDRKLYSLYNKNSLQSELLYGLLHGYNLDSHWFKDMENMYNITTDKLNTAITKVQQKISEISDIDLPKPEEITTFILYKGIKTSWEFFICNLCKFDWYTKFFKSTQNYTGLNSVTSHNGILCGNGDFLSIPNNFIETRDNDIRTILLLKDKYRPRVDVSRDGIRMLPLEAFVDMALLKKHIITQGFHISYDMSDLDEANFSYMPMVNYLNLLSERPDLEEQLVFEADCQLYSFEELQEKIQKSEKIQLDTLPKLSNRSSWEFGKNRDLYHYICMAYLRNKCSLRVSFESYSTNIYIVNGKEDIPQNYVDTFPAAFFLPPLEKDCTYLTSNHTFIRCACNANHPLSQFILKNSQKLKHHVPGIFKELLRSLAEDSGEDLIKNINEMLAHLRKLPGDFIDVPDTLLLTKNDLKS